MQHALVATKRLLVPIGLTRCSLVARAEVAPRLLPAKPVLHPRPHACIFSRVNALMKTRTHRRDA